MILFYKNVLSYTNFKMLEKELENLSLSDEKKELNIYKHSLRNKKTLSNFYKTKDVRSNHELKILEQIWNVLESNSTHEEKLKNISNIIEKRVAEIRIGTTCGWNVVRNIELMNDFRALGYDETTITSILLSRK